MRAKVAPVTLRATLKASLFYVLAVLFGAFGALGFARTAEQMLSAGGPSPNPMQFGLGLGMLFMAFRMFRRGQELRSRIRRRRIQP